MSLNNPFLYGWDNNQIKYLYRQMGDISITQKSLIYSHLFKKWYCGYFSFKYRHSILNCIKVKDPIKLKKLLKYKKEEMMPELYNSDLNKEDFEKIEKLCEREISCTYDIISKKLQICPILYYRKKYINIIDDSNLPTQTILIPIKNNNMYYIEPFTLSQMLKKGSMYEKEINMYEKEIKMYQYYKSQ